MNIARFLAASARSFPDHPAISVSADLYANYARFFDRVTRLAAGYRALPGMKPGDRIALAMKNRPQYFEGMYAAWHAGLCAVPINAKLHPREFAYILENSGARICLVTPDLAEGLAPLVDEIPTLHRVICVEDAEYGDLFALDPLDLQAVEREDPAWLFYTSGTTGKPKGATLTHRALSAMVMRYMPISIISPRLIACCTARRCRMAADFMPFSTSPRRRTRSSRTVRGSIPPRFSN